MLVDDVFLGFNETLMNADEVSQEVLFKEMNAKRKKSVHIELDKHILTEKQIKMRKRLQKKLAEKIAHSKK